MALFMYHNYFMSSLIIKHLKNLPDLFYTQILISQNHISFQLKSNNLSKKPELKFPSRKMRFNYPHERIIITNFIRCLLLTIKKKKATQQKLTFFSLRAHHHHQQNSDQKKYFISFIYFFFS